MALQVEMLDRPRIRQADEGIKCHNACEGCNSTGVL